MVGKKLVGNTLVYGIASLLINGSNFFLIPFYTHFLTPSEYGIITSVTVFSSFTMACLSFGLNGAVGRFYVDFEKEAFSKFVFSIFSMQLAIGFILSVALYLNGNLLDGIFSGVKYDPYLKMGVWIGFFGSFAYIPLSWLQAQSKALLYRTFTTLSFLILTSLMIYLVVHTGGGSVGGVRAHLITNAIMATIYLAFTLRHSVPSVNTQFIKEALVFSLPLMVYTIFGTLTELTSKFFIERYVSLADLGIFNAAQQFASILILVVNAINMAWTPIFYTMAKHDESSSAFASFGKLLIVVLTAIALGVALFTPYLVRYMLSPGYEDVQLYLPILLLAYIVGNGYWVLLVNALSFAKKTVVLPLLTIVSGAASILLNITLVPMVGVLGACYATVATYLVLVSGAYFFFRKHSMVPYHFARMNAIVALAVMLYLVAGLLPTWNTIADISVRLAFIGLFFLLLQVLGVCTLRDVRVFLNFESKH